MMRKPIEMSLFGHTWKVKKFGRRTDSGWITVDDNTGDINFVLQAETSCLVLQNAAVLDAVPLLSDPGVVEGYAKGNLLLIKVANQGHSRKFRLLFALEKDTENPYRSFWNCVNTLRMYFPITDTSVTSKGPATPVQTTPLTDIFKEVLTSTNERAVRSSELFSVRTPLSESVLDDVVRLCLLDSTFPAFVDLVEKSLKSVTKG